MTFLLVVLALMAYSQNDVVVVIDYMKVKPGESGKYLELEKEWKKIHEARLEKGYITGWQLWQKMYAGAEDEYQFIVIEWYENFHKTSEMGYREVISELYSEEEFEALMERTLNARVYVRADVMERVATAENTMPTSFIIVNTMKVKPGKGSDYEKMEKEIFKPMHEESIRRGERSSWSVWNKWIREEDDYQYVTVDGYAEFSQIGTGDFMDVFKTVHPDMNMEDQSQKMYETRIITGNQIWRLVDSVSPEEGHE